MRTVLHIYESYSKDYREMEVSSKVFSGEQRNSRQMGKKEEDKGDANMEEETMDEN